MYDAKISRLQRKLSNLQEEITNLKEDLSSKLFQLDRRLGDLEGENIELRERAAAANREVKDYKHDIKVLTDQVQRYLQEEKEEDVSSGTSEYEQ